MAASTAGRGAAQSAPGGTLSRAPDFLDAGGFERAPPEAGAMLELPSLAVAPGGKDCVTGSCELEPRRS